jgi:hypothetical protein
MNYIVVMLILGGIGLSGCTIKKLPKNHSACEDPCSLADYVQENNENVSALYQCEEMDNERCE